MAIKNQKIIDQYSIYHGDAIEVLRELPKEKIHLSVYSPPFCGMYHYSSSDRDLSNCDSYEDFFKHYRYIVEEISRVTIKGRCTAVHCMDVPSGNSGKDGLTDFPGDIIRLHIDCGFDYITRHAIWKEPLTVRNRTMQKNLAHKTIVDDSIYAGVAGADYLLIFRKKGENPIPVSHPSGFDYYAGDLEMPHEIHKYFKFKGDQKQNRFSHWIWRNYASSFWYDIRLDNVLDFKQGREKDDEKHVHPLQLDVYDRVIIMRSNPGEIILEPFAGVGSGVYSAIKNNRKAIAVELKESYYKQILKNIKNVKIEKQNTLFK